jgi:hypothetical protein
LVPRHCWQGSLRGSFLDRLQRRFRCKLSSLRTSNSSHTRAQASAAAQNFLVPGSCPNIDNIVKNLPIYAPLTVVKGTKASDTTVTYSVKGKLSKKNMLAYLSGQNLPVVVDIKNAKYSKGVTTFQAELPFSSKGFAKGLTVAAVVKNCDKFANAAQVAAVRFWSLLLLLPATDLALTEHRLRPWFDRNRISSSLARNPFSSFRYCCCNLLWRARILPADSPFA